MLSEIFKKPKTDSHSVTKPPSKALTSGIDTSALGRGAIILGKVQLLSLPGAPGWDGQWEALLMRAEQEATALATAGVDGLLVENCNDAPYPSDRMDTAGAIAMSLLINRIHQFTGLPVGVSVLRNDPETALAIAINTKASFIRLPILSGAMFTEDGIMNSRFNNLMQYKNLLKTELPPLLVDINTRHAGPAAAHNTASKLEHLLSLAKALPGQVSDLTLVVSDNDLTPDEVAQLQTAVCREILVESQVHPQQVHAYFNQAHGVILDAGLRKKLALHPDLPPVIDIFQVEETVNRLRQVVPLHEMDPDIFLQR